ncbi:hypothetical protein [Sphaerisporangium aureirubrum]|uniref:Uncharacterized protein n=1 Tax=Sphaerisporangium aureirubrum TaxID=1544736 RepID=A0ABW1NDN3_9ACTN
MVYEFDRRQFLGMPLAWYRYLSQDTTWVPKGRPPAPIAEMDAAWRYNAANWLLRQAKRLAGYYELGEIAHIFTSTAPTVVADKNGHPVPRPEVLYLAPRGEMAQDAFEREWATAAEQRKADPDAWLRSTPLYRALVADLPADVAEAARHWSTCAARVGKDACDCWKRHITECTIHRLRDISAPCHCNDLSPVWTDD